MTSKPPPKLPPIKLPEGVSLHEWSLEKARSQNPRIRAFLGCIKVLDEVFESNFAILHCSPKRLAQIWEQVRKIAGILRQEVAPLLAVPSKIPELEEARESATMYFQALERSLLEKLDALPDDLDSSQEEEIRKLLCVAIGQLHAFLLDTLGEILARDPRSHGDIDYFLTRKFARDVDEAEWLHTSVAKLEEFLDSFNNRHSEAIDRLMAVLDEEKRIPSTAEWKRVRSFVSQIEEELVPHLKMVLGLRGIRLSELELLDSHAANLPALSRTLNELFATSHTALDRIQSTTQRSDKDLVEAVNGAFAAHFLQLIAELHDNVRDLGAYLPVWRQCIEHRRALMLRRTR